MKTENLPEVTDQNELSKGGSLRVVRWLSFEMLKAIGLIIVLVIILWAVKSPGGLEWWRAAIVGMLLPMIKRLL